MKNFYEQDKIQIVKKDKYKIHNFELDICNSFGFQYYESLDNQIQEFFEKIKPTNKPTLFRIVGDFDLLKDADDEEKLYFLVAVVNIFAHHITTEEKLDREPRLMPPKKLDPINLNVGVKKKIVNNIIKFPIFSLELVDKNGSLVYEVFENESSSSFTN